MRRGRKGAMGRGVAESHDRHTRRFELLTREGSKCNIHLYRKLYYQAFGRERITSDLTIMYMEKRV